MHAWWLLIPSFFTGTYFRESFLRATCNSATPASHDACRYLYAWLSTGKQEVKVYFITVSVHKSELFSLEKQNKTRGWEPHHLPVPTTTLEDRLHKQSLPRPAVIAGLKILALTGCSCSSQTFSLENTKGQYSSSSGRTRTVAGPVVLPTISGYFVTGCCRCWLLV